MSNKKQTTVNEPSEAGVDAGAVATLPDAALTPEQIEELKTKAARAEDNWDRLVRLTADFDNFKKRAAKERQDATKFANEALLERLVPVLDNFDMALTAGGGANPLSAEALQKGVTMIFNQFKTAMQESGLEEIDAMGKPFDPNWHEAVSQQESSEAPEGQVLQQLRKGYKLRERLVRPATVIVAKKPGA